MNVISRCVCSLRSGSFICSQHLIDPSKIGTLPCTCPSINKVPKSGLAMSEHSNITSEATSMHCQKHSFWQFSRECNTSFKVLAGANQAFKFGKEKTCTNFNQALLHFGQNSGLLLHCHNLPVEHWGSKVKNI